ncbi:microviridin/marinostatin family tricyclic proteinase inhibitor [Nostoc sp. 'Peltigera membranacea cyanobiont' 213]|uniref:microviridin/marinostatin family tricyclic proteinase inhibitor n=1 Tax=Nostoc sp. 'Peltigera membranacea cyanobiont' 213 TaxID=2014530 RepID=UPI001CB97EFF|nr:microviridin/marinostatin family tricyclic proteinase inhibitor [Nostoc sp. 'Peltigera membranacea cyanobiont' 213]
MKIYLINDIFLVRKTIYCQEKFMPKNTVKTGNVVAVPFFARFLEEQATEGTEVPWTYKFPSDLEDK